MPLEVRHDALGAKASSTSTLVLDLMPCDVVRHVLLALVDVFREQRSAQLARTAQDDQHGEAEHRDPRVSSNKVDQCRFAKHLPFSAAPMQGLARAPSAAPVQYTYVCIMLLLMQGGGVNRGGAGRAHTAPPNTRTARPLHAGGGKIEDYRKGVQRHVPARAGCVGAEMSALTLNESDADVIMCYLSGEGRMGRSAMWRAG